MVKQYLLRCSSVSQDNNSASVDFTSLIGGLLFSDVLILDSVRLLDIPDMVTRFGLEQTIGLFKSKQLKIDFCPNSLGFVNLPSDPRTGEHAFDLKLISAANRDDYMSTCLKRLDILKDTEGLSTKNIVKLKRSLMDIMIDPNPKRGVLSLHESVRSYREDLPLVKDTLSIILKRKHQIDVKENQLEINLRMDDKKQLYFQTNLAKLFPIKLEAERTLLQEALLGIGGVNHRFEIMQELDAISAIKDDELVFLDNKLRFVYQKHVSQNDLKQFNRVLEVTDAPAPPAGKINIEKVLELKNSKDFQEFKALTDGLSKWTDKEIQDYFNAMSNKVAAVYGGAVGKIARIAIPAVADMFHPGVSLALGVLDAFVVDRFIKPKAGVVFMKSVYPSFFQE